MSPQTSINSMIHPTQASCLNEEAEHTVRDLLKGGGGKYLTSDSDAELLMTIPVSFNPSLPFSDH